MLVPLPCRTTNPSPYFKNVLLCRPSVPFGLLHDPSRPLSVLFYSIAFYYLVSLFSRPPSLSEAKELSSRQRRRQGTEAQRQTSQPARHGPERKEKGKGMEDYVNEKKGGMRFFLGCWFFCFVQIFFFSFSLGFF